MCTVVQCPKLDHAYWFLSSMQGAGCLGLVHCDDPEGWCGGGGGRGVWHWEHVYTRGGFMLYFILKKIKKKKKNYKISKMLLII